MIGTRFAARNISLSKFNISLFSSHSTVNVKTRILEHSLPHVHSCGWTDKTLILGSDDAGFSSLSHTIFTRGPVELVEFFLQKKRTFVINQVNKSTFDSENIQELIAQSLLQKAFESHIDFVSPYLNSWSSALALIAQPNELQHSIKHSLDIADDLCKIANIRTTKGDWYVTRSLFVTIYCSTELYMLTDTSENLEDTRKFIKRCLDCYIQSTHIPWNAFVPFNFRH